jgi:hypothetical protein
MVVLGCLLASLVLTPDVSFADRRHHGRDNSPKLHHALPHHVRPPHRRHHQFGPPPHFRPFVKFGVVAPPPVVYVPPPVYATPRPYYGPYYDPGLYAPPPPPVYEPPASSFAPPGGTVSVAPPMPNVIEYPNGRYELRGDGITTPYQWVWIPNPPAGPPPDAPSAPDAPAAPGPASKLELYRWTDEQGAVHWTDRYDAVPEQYRSQATRH